MNRAILIQTIREKRSFLCVGLDPDPERMPRHLKEQGPEGVVAFNKAIIDATRDHCVAYKPNLAFYECWGSEGWGILQKTIDHIPEGFFVIADAKRGDIGNTSNFYAQAFFDQLGVDALTVAPYMGHDSILPFLQHEGKWVIMLALTSNEGALDFQFLRLEVSKKKLYERVIEKGMEWGNNANLMFVVGATQSTTLSNVRQMAPDHFLLVPGVGAQGGSLEEVAELGLTDECGLLVNSSRQILYAGNGEQFAQEAQKTASGLHSKMEKLLENKGIVSSR